MMKMPITMKLWKPKLANLVRVVLSWMLDAKMPRPMQMEAWPVLTGNRERMLVASPGWGKTMMILMIALREQMFEKDRRTLIIAPFKDVGSAYHSKKLWVPDRDWVGAVYFLTAAASAFISLWLVVPTLLLGLPVWRRYATHMLEIENLCGDDSSQTVSRVKEFFLSNDGGKVMACCGASASRAWMELESEYDADTLRKLVKNFSPWFDECHFAKGGERRNRLGNLLHAMVRGHESVRPGLATATPFRADGVIVHDDDIARFDKGTWRCPFDRHFTETMLRTKHMDFSYCAYDGVGGWQDDLAAYVRTKGKRMLVYIPLVNTLASGGKNADYATAKAAILKVFPDADIVNLVDDGKNVTSLETLRRDIRDGDEPDFVIALRMMMVGSDWPNLRSIYDLAPSESLATDGQKCGRLHRDGKNKPTISHRTAFIRFGRMDAEKMRVHCSNRLNAIISVLLMHYIFQGEPLFGPGGASGGGGGGEHRRNSALDWPGLVPFIRAVESRLRIGTEIDNCVRVAREVMGEMDVPDDIRSGLEHIVRGIEGVLSKRTADAVRENGSDPVGMGELSAGMSLQFGTGKVGLEMLENWRNSVRKLDRRSPEEWIPEAERLAAENGGILPSHTWLCQNGYSGLDAVRYKRPELLSHIEQEKNRYTADWPISEKMVERCARDYKEKYGEVPSCRSGSKCLPECWTWGAIYQGFERHQGYTLSKFLIEMGILQIREEYSEEMVKRCAIAYIEKYGKPPTVTSGDDCLSTGWTWCNLGRKLKYGLPIFLIESGLVTTKEEFSEEMVERCARAYVARHGKHPAAKSGDKCLSDGWTWNCIHQRLSSLPNFLIEKGIVESKEKFSEKMVERCVREYVEMHGTPPTSSSGIDCLPDGWKWGAINERLRERYGGLRVFLIENRIVEIDEEYSEEMVDRCVQAYIDKHHRLPASKGADCLPVGWTWSAINHKTAGLLEFLIEKGVIDAEQEHAVAQEYSATADDIFRDMAERCARVYIEKHGAPPVTSSSGNECLSDGLTWRAVARRLNGLPEFLVERGLIEAKEEYSEEMVERCARSYVKKYGKPPTSSSGGDCLRRWTWGSIDKILRSKSGSLSKFLIARGVRHSPKTSAT